MQMFLGDKNLIGLLDGLLLLRAKGTMGLRSQHTSQQLDLIRREEALNILGLNRMALSSAFIASLIGSSAFTGAAR